jgi:hypothetical protein
VALLLLLFAASPPVNRLPMNRPLVSQERRDLDSLIRWYEHFVQAIPRTYRLPHAIPATNDTDLLSGTDVLQKIWTARPDERLTDSQRHEIYRYVRRAGLGMFYRNPGGGASRREMTWGFSINIAESVTIASEEAHIVLRDGTILILRESDMASLDAIVGDLEIDIVQKGLLNAWRRGDATEGTVQRLEAAEPWQGLQSSDVVEYDFQTRQEIAPVRSLKYYLDRIPSWARRGAFCSFWSTKVVPRLQSGASLSWMSWLDSSPTHWTFDTNGKWLPLYDSFNPDGGFGGGGRINSSVLEEHRAKELTESLGTLLLYDPILSGTRSALFTAAAAGLPELGRRVMNDLRGSDFWQYEVDLKNAPFEGLDAGMIDVGKGLFSDWPEFIYSRPMPDLLEVPVPLAAVTSDEAYRIGGRISDLLNYRLFRIGLDSRAPIVTPRGMQQMLYGEFIRLRRKVPPQHRETLAPWDITDTIPSRSSWCHTDYEHRRIRISPILLRASFIAALGDSGAAIIREWYDLRDRSIDPESLALRSHRVVGGILQSFRESLRFSIAHEMAHITQGKVYPSLDECLCDSTAYEYLKSTGGSISFGFFKTILVNGLREGKVPQWELQAPGRNYGCSVQQRIDRLLELLRRDGLDSSILLSP